MDSQPAMTMSISDISGPPIGNYDSCLSIESPLEKDKPTIKGKYCGMDGSWIRNIKEEEINEDLFKIMDGKENGQGSF